MEELKPRSRTTVEYKYKDQPKKTVAIPDVSEKIKLVMVKRKKSGADLSEALGNSRQATYTRLEKNNWKLDQLAILSDMLDCDLEIRFKLRDTEEVF